MQKQYMAIYNSVNKELLVVTEEAQLHKYWQQLDSDITGVYTLTDFEFVDSDTLADYEHDEFIEDGWAVLQ
jgi:hypothetical protein